MKLSHLLRQVTYRVVKGTKDIEIRALRCDSRLVEKGDVFVCIKGYETDGHRYLSEASERGASAVVVQESCPRCRGCTPCSGCCASIEGLTVISTADTRRALAKMAAAYYGYPAEDEGEDDDGLFDPGGPFGGWTPDRADRHGTDRYREAGLILR